MDETLPVPTGKKDTTLPDRGDGAQDVSLAELPLGSAIEVYQGVLGDVAADAVKGGRVEVGLLGLAAVASGVFSHWGWFAAGRLVYWMAWYLAMVGLGVRATRRSSKGPGRDVLPVGLAVGLLAAVGTYLDFLFLVGFGPSLLAILALGELADPRREQKDVVEATLTVPGPIGLMGHRVRTWWEGACAAFLIGIETIEAMTYGPPWGTSAYLVRMVVQNALHMGLSWIYLSGRAALGARLREQAQGLPPAAQAAQLPE